MRVYLRTKFQVSSVILTSFRQGVNLPPTPPPQNKPLKSPPRLVLKKRSVISQRRCFAYINVNYHSQKRILSVFYYVKFPLDM